MKILEWLFGKKEDSKEHKEIKETIAEMEASFGRMDKMLDEMEEDHKRTEQIYKKTMRDEKPQKPAKKERHLKLV